MNPRLWAFDLEMNQPSGSIIQVGAVVGNLKTGQIMAEFDFYINCKETLNPEIIELTGISQDQVDNGPPLGLVKGELDSLIRDMKACKSPVVWGNGDLRTLKSQGGTGYFQNTLREIDIKTVHQMISLSNDKSMRGGLAKSMESYGLKFIGREHNALDDAKNTFRLAHHFSKLLKTPKERE